MGRMVRPLHLNHAADFAQILGAQPQLGGGGGRVYSVTSEDGGLKPKGISGGNSLPHFPVQGIAQLRTKTAQFFINRSSDHNRRTLNELVNSDLFEPGIRQAGRPSVEMRNT